MSHIKSQYLTAAILTVVLAGPPLWWAGEALTGIWNQPGNEVALNNQARHGVERAATPATPSVVAAVGRLTVDN